jgi:hypothetical protein
VLAARFLLGAAKADQKALMACIDNALGDWLVSLLAYAEHKQSTPRERTKILLKRFDREIHRGEKE